MDQANGKPGFGPWSRMFAVVLALVAFVLIPFVAWGEQMDANVPKLIETQSTKWAIALLGIGLLVLDVFVPVPSSVVSISLCLLLGPTFGALAVFSGMVGAFSLGYVSGLLLPAKRLRHWVGTQVWDSLSDQRQTSGIFWVAASRPIPVLAEVTSIFAGSVRLPFGASLAAASTSSLLVAASYGAAAWLGLGQASSSIALFVACVACIPTASWIALKMILRARFAERADSRISP